MAGVANLAARDTVATQMAGVANIAQSAVFQAAGVANLAYLNGKVQLAGISNLSAKNATEVQLAGITNVAQSAAFQGAGVVNLAYYNGGVQLAGVANLSGKDATKTQVAGIANIADTSRCQIGLVNIARKAGVQVGLVNVCDTSDRVMVGLVNIARKGRLSELEISAGLVDNISVAYRLGTTKLYTFAELSHYFDGSLWLLGAGLGTQIPLSKSWGINVEGVSQSVLTCDLWKHDTFNHLSQARVLGYKRFAKYFAVFVGPTFYCYNANTGRSQSADLKAPYSIFSSQHGRIATKAWIGFSVGVRL
jgi:hypothetical protein